MTRLDRPRPAPQSSPETDHIWQVYMDASPDVEMTCVAKKPCQHGRDVSEGNERESFSAERATNRRRSGKRLQQRALPGTGATWALGAVASYAAVRAGVQAGHRRSTSSL